MSVRIAVIGAGLAGVAVARRLSGVAEVTVFEKSRGLGGRMATRRIADDHYGQGVFDYGAQYFTAREPEFLSWVKRWQNAGIVREWSRGFYTEDRILRIDNEPRYIGTKGMRSITKHLARGLSAHPQVRVTKLSVKNQKWIISSESGETFNADSLMLTPPLPQTLQLLETSGIPLPAARTATLQQVSYFRCIALLALLKTPSGIPDPGGVWGSGQPVQWIADNQRKGISPAAAVTIHASPDFSDANWHAEKNRIADQLLNAAKHWISPDSVVSYQNT